MIFFKNLEKINKHNADNTQTYKMGLTQFAVYTDAEFKLLFLTPKVYDPEWDNSNINMPNLAGQLKVLFHQLKIKEIVVHVGLSALLQLWKHSL